MQTEFGGFTRGRSVAVQCRSVRLAWCIAAALVVAFPAYSADTSRRPNVVLIISDDQGFGDLGCHGNPKIRTPYLDRLASESTELSYFYVCPVCAPTRSSLLTGRYNYRTGAVDTALGRAMMYPTEVTLAQMLSKAGYRTGIFGKWHLGDNYPMRPMDKGFQESLVLKGGGIGQPSDPPDGSSYFDPILQHNGTQVKTAGYCSDVYTNAACKFIDANRQQPFFVYLAFNAPHVPLQVPDADYQEYRRLNLALSEFPASGFPVQPKYDADITAKVYGMVTNLDRNIGRLLAKLEELKLADDTIVIFLTDNGPQQPRYNAGMHGIKGTVYDGGIRVPFFIRWPKNVPAGRKIDRVAAHIDVTPTLLDACAVEKPAQVKMDGISLLPLLKGATAELPDRTLFFQWHRGNKPEQYRACAARAPRWKLVQPVGMGATAFANNPRFELYDMKADPFEQRDLAAEQPQIVERLKQEYEVWFKDVSSHGYPPARIHLGTRNENPTVLTRQDWRGEREVFTAKDIGSWEVQVTQAADYEIIVTFRDTLAGKAHFVLGTVSASQELPGNSRQCRFGPVRLTEGPGRLETWLESSNGKVGAWQVEVKRIGAQ